MIIHSQGKSKVRVSGFDQSGPSTRVFMGRDSGDPSSFFGIDDLVMYSDHSSDLGPPPEEFVKWAKEQKQKPNIDVDAGNSANVGVGATTNPTG